jgi:hypothetical protein
MSQISELLSREEVMEKQRSRLHWFKGGDRNTAFFQAKSREREKTNKISSLIHDDGSMVTKQEDLELCAVDFYRNLFSAQEVLEPDVVLQHVPCKVSDDIKESLTCPFTVEEVKKAIFMMGPNKHLV